MKMGYWFFLVPALFFFGSSALNARAEDHRERAHWHGEIRYFHEHDLPLWRSGHWFQGPHLGRAGWWWVANGIWYYYPRRVAAIPDPYIPPSVAVQLQAPAPPPVVIQQPPPPPVVVQQPPQVVVQVPPPSAGSGPSAAGGPPDNVTPPAPVPQSWYYCNNPHGYYPYVTSCQGPWTSVPATPPGATP